MARLDELESRLQGLLEVYLLKYLPGYKAEDKVAQQLAAVLHSNLVDKGDDSLQAPNVYVIIGHPSTLARWRSEPRLLGELAEALYTVGKEAGFTFITKPTVTTAADVNMKLEDLRILASSSNQILNDTRGLPVTSNGEPASASIPTNAFLILHGTKIVPLNRTVINIGRRLDNQVVVDDPRVSRAHAQLRIVKDRFVLFDLNSTGGTYVNGVRTHQSVLYPGDVISLAGVTLIFGQDLPPGRTADDKTGPASPISADRPTAILHKEKDPQEKDKK
ncbi:MAG: FhaA domain-containing protein [Anaerolineales bacterium]|jgi:hypothetical protein